MKIRRSLISKVIPSGRDKSGKTTGFTSFLWGFHAGASGSVEIPLAVLWTAKTVYPEILTTVNMAEEVDNFYRTFFNFEAQR